MIHALFASILTIFLKLLLFCCYFKKKDKDEQNAFVLDEEIASRLSGVSVNKLWGEINENALDLGLKVVKNGEYYANNKAH